MAAPFRELADEMMAEVDDVMAERVGLAFLRDGVSDPDRENVDILAPLRTGDGSASSMAGSLVQSWRVRIAAGKAELQIDRTAYPGIVLRAKDKVRALDRPGQPWFEVLHVDDRSLTRLIVQLGEA
jgi:hypothetical protein